MELRRIQERGSRYARAAEVGWDFENVAIYLKMGGLYPFQTSIDYRLGVENTVFSSALDGLFLRTATC